MQFWNIYENSFDLETVVKTKTHFSEEFSVVW